MRLERMCKYKRSKTWACNPRDTQIWTWILGQDGSSERCSRKCNYISKTQTRLLEQHK